MSGESGRVVATGLSLVEAADRYQSVLASGKELPEMLEANDGTYTVTARSYSGGFRPYTRWPMRKIDYTLRFRVTKPYKKPEVTPFLYPRGREEYETYIGEKAHETYKRLEEEAEERQQEHEDAYKRTIEHIEEALGVPSNVRRDNQAVPEESVRLTIDQILRRGYFIDPDEEDDERSNPYAR